MHNNDFCSNLGMLVATQLMNFYAKFVKKWRDVYNFRRTFTNTATASKVKVRINKGLKFILGEWGGGAGRGNSVS